MAQAPIPPISIDPNSTGATGATLRLLREIVRVLNALIARQAADRSQIDNLRKRVT